MKEGECRFKWSGRGENEGSESLDFRIGNESVCIYTNFT